MHGNDVATKINTETAAAGLLGKCSHCGVGNVKIQNCPAQWKLPQMYYNIKQKKPQTLSVV